VHADVLACFLLRVVSFDAERVEVEAGHLLVEVLGQRVDASG